MNNLPFFSIVIPTYNRAGLICDTIDSILAQEYDNYEVLIVDDGSTDDTEEVIKAKYKNNRVSYYKKENAERAAARNYGARLANGDYINFFDSDDLALPNHLTVASKLINTKNFPEWFHLGYAWALPEGKIFKEVNDFKGESLNHIMHKGNPLSCNGIFIRRDVILANQFNEDRLLSASEDYELWLRLTSNFPLQYSNTITSVIIDHEARSVRKINGHKLIERLEALLTYVEANQTLKQYFKGRRINRIKLEGNSYIALHLSALTQFKSRSLHYLFKSLAVYPSFIFNKRFYATIKNLIIRWQKY